MLLVFLCSLRSQQACFQWPRAPANNMSKPWTLDAATHRGLVLPG